MSKLKVTPVKKIISPTLNPYDVQVGDIVKVYFTELEKVSGRNAPQILQVVALDEEGTKLKSFLAPVMQFVSYYLHDVIAVYRFDETADSYICIWKDQTGKYDNRMYALEDKQSLFI